MNFFEWWFRDIEDLRISLFATRERGQKREIISRVCNMEDFLTACAELYDKYNLYYGVCAAPTSYPPVTKKRPSADEVVAISGLWADVDVDDDDPLRLSKGEFKKFLQSLPLAPSAIVYTGHGYHLYWKLKEPETFEDENRRQYFKNLVYSWNRMLDEIAKGITKRKVKIDNVGDLARVMRVPGSLNLKFPDMPVKVRIVSLDASREYLTDNFEDFCQMVSIAGIEAERELIKDSKFKFSYSLKAPRKKLEAAIQNSERFKDTWNRNRSDLKDQSLSGYDISIAHQLKEFGWKNEEIIAALVEFRERFGGKRKPFSYYLLTLSKVEKEQRDEELTENIEAASMLREGLKNRDGSLELLSGKLGVKIMDIRKVMVDPPEYLLITETGRITIPSVEVILSPRKFRATIAAVSNIVIPILKQQDWDPIAQLILDVALPLHVGDAAVEVMIKYALIEYLTQSPKLPITDYIDKNNLSGILEGEDGLYFKLADFKDWIKTHIGETISSRKLGQVLKGLRIDTRRPRLNYGTIRSFFWFVSKDRYESLTIEGEQSNERVQNIRASGNGEDVVISMERT